MTGALEEPPGLLAPGEVAIVRRDASIPASERRAIDADARKAVLRLGSGE